MAEQISRVKEVVRGGEIQGYQEEGGLIIDQATQKLMALKHNDHRYNDGDNTQPWGRKNYAYLAQDMIEVGYQFQPFPTTDDTCQINSPLLEELSQGQLPPCLTIGAEVEASAYNSEGTELLNIYKEGGIDISKYPHPELLNFTLETATLPIENRYPVNAAEIAQALSKAILKGYELADAVNGLLCYTSVPEGGSGRTVQYTPHPYLLSFAPRVLDLVLKHQDQIPVEVLEIYQMAGINILAQLEETGVLNWPTQALHVHSGIPTIEGLADPRTALAMGLIKQTQLAKTVSLLLHNTRHFYGAPTEYSDIRAIIRRLLPTTHNSTIPNQAIILFKQAVKALQAGEIHSLGRYPASGQHDVVRFRMDGDKKTVESIDAPMHPDLRLVLMWTYLQQILNVIALDALVQVNGDESQVLPYLQSQNNTLFKVVNSLGTDSSFAQDLLFSAERFNQTIKTQINSIIAALDQYAAKYPAITTMVKIVNYCLRHYSQSGQKSITVAQYLGTASGTYTPHDCKVGIITDCKTGSLPEILQQQHYGTQLQAQALNQVLDKQDLLAFFGIC